MLAVQTAPRSGALGLNKESSHPRRQKPCERCGSEVWLRASDGQIVRPSCGCPNLCEACRRSALRIECELLQLDAVNGVAPSIWLVLGSRSTARRQSEFARSWELVMRAIKRRWPEVQYWRKLEFTTGYGPRSGGRRRAHWNVMLKGIPVDDVDELRELVLRIWCTREDALPARQHVGLIRESGGLIRYLAAHIGKESQAPPKGWKGQAATHSRGYLWLPVAEARQVAKDALAYKVEVRKAIEEDLDADQVHDVAAAAVAYRKTLTWQLWFGDGSEESHFLYERDRVAGRWGGWKGAKAAPVPHIELPSLDYLATIEPDYEPMALW